MDDYRTRLEMAGVFGEFDRARKAKDKVALREILLKARFTEIEIESLVWSDGDMPEPPTPEEKKKRLVDDIVGRIGTGIVTGIVLGGIFAYASTGLSESDSQSQKSNKLMSDYRSPTEAYYKPFLWGFGLGSVAGLIIGESFLIGIMKEKFKDKDQ
jgi:hypothetical protein